MKPLALLLALVALTGCQGLSQALGVQPKADAPSYTVVGVYARDGGTAGDVAKSMRSDQSGAVGASGQATGDAAQTLEVPAEVVESLVSAAQALIAAGNPTAASAVLGAIGPAKKAKPEKPAPAPAPAPAEPAAPAVPK